ncbi:1,2-diacylglycerol-3-alpha-glucose alpha-1,2-galactosyltransferase [Pseudarthrobacter sp. W1I19]|uniref:glycosyltransferase n=1 Tax=Pseudarthrobacter sp. W1I19 TaxID=3042288 RepID=UPI0027813574|nr:1,2-diacylglycerol-3-alpha-glucose alpha-1,2-galactosyltransferase [Pseudarthrobacter sp. W1I19]
MRVNVISESSFTVKGHGVHSVYKDNLKALRETPGLDVFSKIFAKSDVVHLHTAGPVAVLMMRYSATRSVVTAHLTPDSLVGSLAAGRLLARIARRYLRWFYSRADAVIALSAHMRDQLDDLGVTSPITVIPNAIFNSRMPRTISRMDARKAIAVDPDTKIVLSVGQLQPRKGIWTFHRCARLMPETLFIWVGAFPFGPLTASYWTMRRMLKSKPANVVHAGHLPREYVKTYYSAADVYFHPSYHELDPVAVLEAAASGLPLVLRDLECYRSAPTASYVLGTDSTFTEQLRSLCNDEGLRSRRADEAARWAASRPHERAAIALVSLYERLVQED